MNGTTPLEQAGAEFRQATQDARLVALARTHPDWHVWRCSNHRWHATRHTPLDDREEEAAGCARTIDADTLDELVELLADQVAISSRYVDASADSRPGSSIVPNSAA